MIGKWHLGSDPQGFDRWEILPGQGVYFDPVLYTATGEKTYTGRYATDVITDRALDFLRQRPRGKPFFLMVHHKAPHRPWEPDAAHARAVCRRGAFPNRSRSGIATRRARMRCTRTSSASAADLTNRDLKLTPADGPHGPALAQWRRSSPTR